MKLTDNMVQWLANGDRGISSETIFTHLTGVNALDEWEPSVPHDYADFKRCYVLLEQCPELKENFKKMTEVKGWKRLVERWSDLEVLYKIDNRKDLYKLLKNCIKN